MVLRNKKVRWLLLASMLFIFMSGKNLINAASLREEVCLNGVWDFVGVTTRETDAIPSTGYTTCKVPGSWWFRQNYTDTNWSTFHQGWYKLPLNIPSTWTNRRIKIYFERVNHFAMVFINGTKVGMGHQESFTPFEVDITTFVTLGGTNTLYVYNEDSWRSSVDINGNSTPGQRPYTYFPGTGQIMDEYNIYSVPTGEYMSRRNDYGGYYTGIYAGFGDIEKGIWGNVFLRTYSPVYVEDTYIVTSVRENKKITTRLYLRNDDSSSHSINIVNTVVKDGVDKLTVGDSVQLVSNPDLPSQSKTSTTLPITIPARSSICIEVSKTPWDTTWSDPGGPKLWGIGKAKIKNGASFDYIDYGDPILYFLKTSLTESGQTLDTKYSRFGFRELWTYYPEDTTDTYSYPNGKYNYHLYLNGKRIFLQAGCLEAAHESFTWNRQNIVVLYRSEQGRNMNLLRLHCYSPSGIWFDVADELGMLVVPEVHLRNNSGSPSKYCQNVSPFSTPYGSGTQSAGISAATTLWTKNTKQFFRDYVKAYRNHPSIANWSNGNEIFQVLDGGTSEKNVNRYGRLKAMVDIVDEAVRLVDPTRRVSSSGRSAYLKFTGSGSSGVCSLDTNLYGVSGYDFVDARKVFVYEARIPQDAPYTADQAFTNWQTKYKKPVMDSEEELDMVPGDKIDPGMAANNMTLVEAGFNDWAKFFYIDPNPATRFNYVSTNRTYNNTGNTIARAAFYQIPRYNVFSVPIRSQWLRPQLQETVFGSASSSPLIIWPSMSGEGLKAKQLPGGSARTTYNWFASPTTVPAATIYDGINLYKTNMVWAALRDGFANCPPYGAMPKCYEAGWYTDSAYANGLPRVPEVIITLKNGGTIMPGAYVYLEPATATGPSAPPVGVMTDSTGKAWFTLKEAGNYKVVYYNNSGTRLSMALQSAVTSPYYKDWTIGGYDYIQNFDVEITNFPAADSTPPATINTLASSLVAVSSATLRWTAVGDDGTTGTAGGVYDVRYANIAITESNWATATPCTGEPVPAASGTQQTLVVNSLTPNTQYYFAMKVTDDSSNTSALSNVLSLQTLPFVDTTPPDPILTLATFNIGVSSLTLGWTSTGDDGSTGTATSYDIRYSLTLIDNSNFSSATPCANIPAPLVAGTQQSLVVTGLTDFTSYYFAIKATDENSNTSALSNVVVRQTLVAPDTTAPAAINTLTTLNVSVSSMTLRWTAVGDDGTTGTATSYNIRYQTYTITSSNFASATPCSNIPTPQTAGTQQTLAINNLTANTMYYFAMKVTDDNNNISTLSNVVSSQTFPSADVTSPAAVSNLSLSNVVSSSMTLTWTATGDDGTTGTANNYDIRYQTFTITSGNFANAIQCANIPAPQAAGTQQTLVVNNLTPETTYYFAMKIADEAPNTSGISNVVSSHTLIAPDITSPAAIDTLTTINVFVSSVTLNWTSVGDDGTTGTATSYDIRYMVGTSINSSNWVSATALNGETAPTVSGTQEALTVTGLTTNTQYYFAIKVTDDNNNTSLLSNVASTQTLTVDLTAPASVTLSTGNISVNSITLSWTAVGDDGTTGTATSYDIRYALTPITGGNFASATQCPGIPTPQVAGTQQTLVVNNLTANTTYYFAMKVADESSNTSLSNLITVKTAMPSDTIAPADVANLTSGSPTSTSITLTWTAVGDDGNGGTASGYDIRYLADTPITSSNWDTALQCANEPAPKVAASAESFVVNQLTSNTQYYFAVKVGDDVSNWSGLSNSPTGTTSTSSDATPPATIANLVTSNPTSGSITLTWTAVGDDGTVGTATEYDIRYSNVEMTDLTHWLSTALQVTGETTPKISGSNESFTVNGLQSDTLYYFQMRVRDEVGTNWSSLSNQANGQTLLPTLDTDPPAAINNLLAVNPTMTMMTLTWTATGNDGNIGTATRYDIRYMAGTPITSSNWNSAIPCVGVPTPQVSGTPQNFIATGLEGNTLYYFGIKAGDGNNNWSSISNVTSATTASSVVFSAPVSEWHFDEGAGTFTLDASANNNTASIPAGTGSTWVTPGKVGNSAISFDGTNSYLLVMDNPILAVTTELTIEAWVKSDVNTADGSTRRIVEKGVYALGASNQELFKIMVTTGVDISVARSVTYAGFTTGEWHHIVGTYDADGGAYNMKLYSDGVLVASATVVGNLATNTANLFIGASGTTSNRFDGTIDEVRIYNVAINQEEIVARFGGVVPGPDTTAPSIVADLVTSNPTQSTITLTWTAPGDDGNVGRATSNDIRYTVGIPILDDMVWDAATKYIGEPIPVASGLQQTLTITGLTPNTQYYFALEVGDEVYNFSDQSNSPDGTTMIASNDSTPPSAITSLTTSNPTLTSVTLRWTATGDDGTTGTATSYDIRYMAGTPITSTNWASAIPCTGETAPKVASTAESFVVNGLNSGTQYYFAIEVGDDVPNWSNVSNSPSANTSGTYADTIAPSNITNLTITSVSTNTITLRWTAPGDDTVTGTATIYDVRYRKDGAVSASNWASSTLCTGEPTPGISGTTEIFAITGLDQNTMYYFGIKSGDEITNWSGVSIASARTGDNTIPTSISYLAATPLDGGKMQLSWMPSTSDDVVAYNIYMSTSGTFNYITPYTTVSSTTTAMTVSGLTNNQQYSFVVRAVDNTNYEDPNTNIIAETAAISVDDTVTQLLVPRNGMTVSGKRVTLLADAIIGDLSNIESVQFEFKRNDETTWTKMPTIVSGLTNPDITSPYYVQWDVSNLDAGYQYNVRAVVTDINGVKETKPGYVTVTIGGSDADLVESNNWKYERIDNRRDNIVRMVEPTVGQMCYVKISSGVLDTVNTRLKIVINPATAPAVSKNLVLIGYIHKIDMESGQKTFSKELEIGLPYKDTDADNRIDDKEIGTNKLMVCSYNESTGKWEKVTSMTLDKTNKVVIAKTTHLSYYGIFASLQSDLSVSHVYPNPFKPSLGHTKIFFANLTSRAKVQIFDVSGDLVYEEEKDTPTGELGWDVKNSKGEPIASGVYIYLITNNSGQTKKGKLAIIR